MSLPNSVWICTPKHDVWTGTGVIVRTQNPVDLQFPYWEVSEWVPKETTSVAKPGDWMENKQNLANGVHCALSYAILLTTAFLSRGSLKWILAIEIALTIFVLVKEYWYDLRYETGETIKTSTEDALGWLIGNGIAWTVIAIACWVGIW